MELDEMTYTRRLLENPLSARKYSQVFAVAALLCELHNGSNRTNPVWRDIVMLCS
jgi:hypothetical protein